MLDAPLRKPARRAERPGEGVTQLGRGEEVLLVAGFVREATDDEHAAVAERRRGMPLARLGKGTARLESARVGVPPLDRCEDPAPLAPGPAEDEDGAIGEQHGGMLGAGIDEPPCVVEATGGERSFGVRSQDGEGDGQQGREAGDEDDLTAASSDAVASATQGRRGHDAYPRDRKPRDRMVMTIPARMPSSGWGIPAPDSKESVPSAKLCRLAPPRLAARVPGDAWPGASSASLASGRRWLR